MNIKLFNILIIILSISLTGLFIYLFFRLKLLYQESQERKEYNDRYIESLEANKNISDIIELTNEIQSLQEEKASLVNSINNVEALSKIAEIEKLEKIRNDIYFEIGSMIHIKNKLEMEGIENEENVKNNS